MSPHTLHSPLYCLPPLIFFLFFFTSSVLFHLLLPPLLSFYHQFRSFVDSGVVFLPSDRASKHSWDLWYRRVARVHVHARVYFDSSTLATDRNTFRETRAATNAIVIQVRPMRICVCLWLTVCSSVCRNLQSLHPIFETSCFIFHIYTHTNTDACMQKTFCWCAEERQSVVFLIQSLGNWSAPHGTVVQRKRQKARDTPRPKVET